MAGPDAISLRGPHLPEAYAHGHEGNFAISKDETVDLELTWFPSHRQVPTALDVDEALEQATQYWIRWGSNVARTGPTGMP